MENLTKQQIVLVTLLVSFVTSIATGIVTVTLMDQAPAGVTQTINRVVERTIERVVQAPSQASVITKETVVVKEDDLVVAAIEQNVKSLVRFVYTGSENGNVLALGLILSKDGIIVVDTQSLVSGMDYSARFADGNIHALKHVFDSKDGGLALYKVVPPEKETVAFTHATLADSDKIKLGQTVVFVGGRDDDTIETGLVSNVEYEDIDAKEERATTTSESNVSKKIMEIYANVRAASSVGGILANLSSDIIALGIMGETISFVPSNRLTSVLGAYSASLATSSVPSATR